MASRGFEMGLVMVLVAAVLCGGAIAQSGCSNTLSSLSPCLNYITGNSSTPSSSCCLQLGNVVQSSPQCLCSVLNGAGASLGITINQTLALSLPGACQVQTPPINQCKAAGVPTTSPPAVSPSGSPSGSSDDTPEPSITPSASAVPSDAGTGSKTVPTSSDGSITKGSIHFVLIIALCALTITNKF